MPAKLQVIKQQRVSDVAYEMLRDSILRRVLVPGKRLDIDTISSQMGISRMPVKQALSLLAAEGLVEIIPRKGTFVAAPSYTRVSDVFDVRSALELLAAEHVIPRMTPRRLKALRRALDAFDLPDQDGDVASHMEKNAHFHALIVEFAENKTLAEMYAQLGAHIQIARVHHRSPHWQQRIDLERHEHWAIYMAIEEGRLDALTSMLKMHLARAKQSLLDDIAESPALQQAE